MLQRTSRRADAVSVVAFLGAVACWGACAFGSGSVDARTATAADGGKALEGGVLVTVNTSVGSFVLELNPDAAPYSVKNFIDYAKSGFYKGTIFHRVVKNYLIQGGALLASMKVKTKGVRDPIPLESDNGLANMRGTIAMFHAALPDSATTQFFINVSDNAGRLDRLQGVTVGYAVFGKVVQGMDVVDRIAQAKVAAHPAYGAGKLPVVPVEPIVIRSIRLNDPTDVYRVERLVEAKEKERQRQLALARKTSDEWLAEYVERTERALGMKFIETDDHWKYMDVNIGRGPAPLPRGSVLIQYRGTLVTGREFENNIGLENPPWYEMDNLIPGLRMALTDMQVGGKRIVIIPPNLAFGEEGIPRGVPPKIPPNATLIYELELLDVRGN